MSTQSRAAAQEIFETRKRLLGIGVVMALVLSLLTWKMTLVQWKDGSDLAARGRSQRSHTVETPAQRGAILDRNGVEMAISVPRRRVVVNMNLLAEEGVENRADFEQLAALLAPKIGVDAGTLATELIEAEPSDPWVPLAETVDVKAAKDAVAAIEKEGIHGALTLEESSLRMHPAGESALRVIGTMGIDGPGKLAGVEKAFDKVLSGTDGVTRVETSAKGATIVGSESVVKKATPGSAVQLTLDRTMQHELERILAAGSEKANAARGIAIVGRPSTGEILAVGSVERDDKTGNLELSNGPLAFTNAYQAGSVFKLVTVAAAVESHQVTGDTVIEVPDQIQVDDKVFSDHDPHPTRPMSVTEIVADSSNVGTIKIAQGVGKKGLYDALRNFGFGSKTGTAHPAEASGILPPLDRWTNPDLAASAIGTHQSATALQLWGAYNVIANGGVYVQPRIVESIISPTGKRTTPKMEEPRRVVSQQTSDAVSKMLQAVVSEGTGKEWTLPGYSVAAKTGTSRMAAPHRPDKADGYIWDDGHYHYLAAFTGFLPADRPQVSITVILDDIRSGLYGSSAAGPIFSELARLSIRELGIAPNSEASTGSDQVALLPGTSRNDDGRIRTTPATRQVIDEADEEEGGQ